MSAIPANGPLGLRVVTGHTEDGTPWYATQAGGLPGDEYAFLALSLACSALHDALAALGIGPEYGPAPVAITLSETDFLRLRDAIAPTDDSRGAMLFKRPRRKRMDRTLRSFMWHGIVVRAGDMTGVSFACPLRQPGGKP